MRLIYHAVSYLFFPGTMAVAGFYSILLFEGKTPTLDLLWLPTFMFLLAPVIILFMFLKFGLISDIHVTDRKQRSLSYPIAIAFAILYVLISRGESWVWWHWGAAVFLTLVFLLIVNLSWLKASAHMAGTAGFLVLSLLAFTKGESINWVYLAAAICGLVYVSRKGLSAHSHIELLAGFCLGFIVTFVTFRL
jgi:hypothetical protein